jgi:hypoxia up-regulated 1
MFSNVDLVLPQTLYDTISKWLEEKLAEQEKLPVTADPVILVKDIATKTKQLQDATVDLLSRSMRKPYKNKKPAPKPKTSSSKKPKATSTKSAGAEKTLDFEGKPFVTVNPGDDMPTEEQILEWIAQQKAEGEAAEAGGAGGAAEAAEAGEAAEAAEEKQAEQEKPATKKHDEL